MRRRIRTGLAAAVAVVALGLTACSTTPQAPSSGGAAPSSAGALTPVKLQLQWVTQGQFAGYFAAVDQGFYRKRGLDVQILEGGVDIVPQTVLAQGSADYAIAWVPKALASREQGAGITDVAQIFQRSGTYQVSFADKGITAPADLRAKKVGNWGFGNEFELFAGMTRAGIAPGDVTLVQQQFDMQALLNGEIDAAQAMSYNEYAQVLEATNPATGQLYQPSDFNIINWNDAGTAMLQDAIWANTEKLSDPTYQDTTAKFITASLEGWI
jgi:NitT/TauT family transport system substrate-binding protein